MVSDPIDLESPGGFDISIVPTTRSRPVGATCTIEQSGDLLSWRSFGERLDMRSATSIRLKPGTYPRYLRLRLDPPLLDLGARITVVRLHRESGGSVGEAEAGA